MDLILIVGEHLISDRIDTENVAADHKEVYSIDSVIDLWLRAERKALQPVIELTTLVLVEFVPARAQLEEQFDAVHD